MEQTRRVVVTGLGVISPVGNTVDECWNNLKNGVHGIGPITLFDTTDYKTKIAAEVKNFDPRTYMDKTEVLRSDAFAQYGVAAAAQAVEESGVIGTLPPERGIRLGNGVIRRHRRHPHLHRRAQQALGPWPQARLPLLYPHAHRQHGCRHDRHSLQLPGRGHALCDRLRLRYQRHR